MSMWLLTTVVQLTRQVTGDLVDWQELSPADIEYLYELAEKSDVQLTLFDEEHYFVLGGKPNQVIKNDAKLVFSDLTEISLEEATSGKYRMFQGMFWVQKSKQMILKSVFLKSFANVLVEFVRSLSFMKPCHLEQQRLPLFLD